MLKSCRRLPGCSVPSRRAPPRRRSSCRTGLDGCSSPRAACRRPDRPVLPPWPAGTLFRLRRTRRRPRRSSRAGNNWSARRAPSGSSSGRPVQPWPDRSACRDRRQPPDTRARACPTSCPPVCQRPTAFRRLSGNCRRPSSAGRRCRARPSCSVCRDCRSSSRGRNRIAGRAGYRGRLGSPPRTAAPLSCSPAAGMPDWPT